MVLFQFLRDLDDEISAIKLEEESLKRKMNGKNIVHEDFILERFVLISHLDS